MSKYCSQLNFIGIVRSTDDMIKRNGHVLEDDIERLLKSENFESRHEVVMPDSLKHTKLLLGVGF